MNDINVNKLRYVVGVVPQAIAFKEAYNAIYSYVEMGHIMAVDMLVALNLWALFGLYDQEPIMVSIDFIAEIGPFNGNRQEANKCFTRLKRCGMIVVISDVYGIGKQPKWDEFFEIDFTLDAPVMCLESLYHASLN